MGTLEFIFASNEVLSTTCESNGSSRSSPNMITDITNDTSVDDQFPGFDLDDLFNPNDSCQTSGSNGHDHEYCLQEDNLATFEQNFNLSKMDSNFFDGFDFNMNNILPNLHMELKESDFPSDISFGTVQCDGGSPTTSEELLQTFQSFPSSPGSNTFVIVPDVQKEMPPRTQCIILSEDEHALLSKEGINLPVNVPLTREEERMVKVVRRKIRNKISAKMSRMKKQNYVDGLEQRIKICTQQNRDLQAKVEKLQKQNLTLALQLKKLQDMLFKPHVTIIARKRQMQAGGCLMVLILSFALFVLPSMAPWLDGSKSFPDSPQALSTGRKILQDSNLLKTDYIEEYGTSPHILLDGLKINPTDHGGSLEDNPTGEGRPIPEQYILVLDDHNYSYNRTSIRGSNRNDL